MAFNKEQLRAYWAANKESLNAKRRERRRLAKRQASLGVSHLLELNSAENKQLNSKVSPLKSRLAVVKEEKADLKGRPPNGYEQVSQFNSQANEEVKQEKARLKPSKLNNYEQVSPANSQVIKQVKQEKVSQSPRKPANKSNLGTSFKVSQKGREPNGYEQNSGLKHSENKQVSQVKVSQKVGMPNKDSLLDSQTIEQVSQAKVSPKRAKKLNPRKLSQLMANLPAHSPLRKLIQQWLTFTNYACSPTCTHTYCSNCWYFEEDRLVDYKYVPG
jgi:hypothetical protein